MSERSPVAPFLKWPGGKRWLAPTIAKLIGSVDGRYFEPFLGGGAVFFHLRPQWAVLSDCNSALMEVYKDIKANVEGVIGGMKGLRRGKDRFQEVRAGMPSTRLSRTIRFLYLNKTAFNGMYRVNRRGEFNVPYGCKTGTVICDKKALRAASIALQDASLHSRDFTESIAKAEAGDVVYCDPPFTVKHDNNGFIRYNESLFSWHDQMRLAKACLDAAARGVRVIVSNAHHEPIRILYDGFVAKTVIRRCMISATVDGRGSASEYLLLSPPLRSRLWHGPKRCRRLRSQEC